MARRKGAALICLWLLLPLPLWSQPLSTHAVTATLTVAGISDPLHPSVSAPAALSASARTLQKGTRFLHEKPATVVNAVETNSTGTVSTLGSNPEHTETLLRNFNGVSSLDSAVTNFGAEFEPPDQGLCVGNGFVVEPVNSAFTIYRSDGSVVAGPFNVNVLFNEGLTEFTSDPRCYFDPSTHTWFAIILFIRADNLEARTDIAVNTSGDPTTAWTVYHLEATDDGTDGTPIHPACPCFGDQPLLGIDHENVYISTNEFPIAAVAGFNGAQIYAISKKDLIAHDPNPHFVHFDNLTVGGTIAASVQPAITHDGHAAEYFLSSIDPTGTFDDRIGVWALTHQEAVSEGGVPTLSNLVVTSESFGSPPGAVQRGSASLLCTGDDRMMQVQFIHGNLWGALGTALPVNGTNPHAAIAWFKIHPRLHDNAIGAAELEAQGYVSDEGNDLFYPSIEASPTGSVGMVMTLSGPALFASAAYTMLTEDHESFGPIKIAALGTGPYDPTATRWGDYSAAALDPSGESFWFATEYIPPLASQTPDGLRNWGTRVLQVATREDK